jgi:hypothetical protein
MEWDPIGVADVPECRDEYDCVMGPMLRMLEQQATEEQLSMFLQTELRDHFGLTSEPPARQDAFAAKARAWYQARWRDTVA